VCGIAGIARGVPRGVDASTLARMAAAIQHRGPDGFGYFAGRRIGLAHTRLGILDLQHGAQPLANEDGRVQITYNGEIYNFADLRHELAQRGHRFATATDTEVLVHGYEEWGTAMLDRLEGQFAFAIHDRRDDSLFLARDRFGICPLFHARRGDSFYFASEIKALFASGEVDAAPDFAGLDEVFTFWGARAPRTVFREVYALEPGCFARWHDGRLEFSRYFAPAFDEARTEPADALAQLDATLRASVARRLRADVPVGGYLSGGLDSSITCALASAGSPHRLRTFSVSFSDATLDEAPFQRLVADSLGTEHAVVRVSGAEIATVFPRVVAHTETPLVRTAPAPMYLLSALARQHDIKVVLTGEGADECFFGYDIFKETAIRQFCLRQPTSAIRPRLLDRLYPYLGHGGRGGAFWRRFFLDAGSPDDPLFSHLPRFRLTSRIKDFYSAETRAAAAPHDVLAELRDALPAAFGRWSALARAGYLEMVTLLPSYLLASQGDRMIMGNGVEGRYPFLDHHLFALCATLPSGSKLRGLREKEILRRWAKALVPPAVHARHKQPYRAPDAATFFGDARPAWVDELLSSEAIQRTGYFEATAVAGLARRCAQGRATGFGENQALVAILSTQLWHEHFLAARARPAPLPLDRASVAWHEDPSTAPYAPTRSAAPSIPSPFSLRSCSTTRS